MPKPPSGTASMELASSAPALGMPVTFKWSAPGVKNPRIEATAYQGDTVVWSSAGAASEAFKLGGDSSDWQRAGGQAHCVAKLFYWDQHPEQRQVVLAETTFEAGG